MRAEKSVLDARSVALSWQAEARNREPEPRSTEDSDRERVQALTSPGAHVAAALLAITGWPAVALDADTLEPASSLLTTPGQVWSHFRHRNADGVGLPLGLQSTGATLVAVRGTAKAWADWIADVGVLRRPRQDDGREDVSLRPMSRYATVNWSPPARLTRSTGAVFGADALQAATQAMRPANIGTTEHGYVVWAVDPDAGRELRFPATRDLGHGLNVCGSGVVPWQATRADGWTLSASGVPIMEEMPDWLVTELGGRWRRAA